MKMKKWNRKGFTLVELLVVIAIIVALAALATPAILKQRKKVDKVQAISNAKQVYLLMMDFESDFGSFPDSKTAEASNNAKSFNGNTANSLLGQLIAEGFTTSEEIFYAKGGNAASNKKPDNVVSPEAQILKAGECGFAYTLVTGGTSSTTTARGLSTSDNGGIPILTTPVTTGGAEAIFNPSPFDNRGVYLRVDGSAREERINPNDNKVKIGGGKTLFQSGEGTVWGEGDTKLNPQILLPQ